MGDNTSTYDFYLIEDEDPVDVDNDINYNFKKIDKVMNLIDYKVVDSSYIDGDDDISKEVGYKFYKRHSNSIWYCRTKGKVSQDPNTQVDTWNADIGPFVSGYSSQNADADRILVSVRNGFVTFRGRLVLNNGATDFPTNTTVNFLTVPYSILPTRPRYFMVGGGRSTGSPQLFRIYIPPSNSDDPRIEYVKYGGVGATAADRYLCLNQVSYPLDDTAA